MPAVVRPVAVTGIGIRSPFGTAAEHWASIVDGLRAVRRLSSPGPSAIPTADADWSDWMGAPAADPELRQNVLGSALFTATEAIRQARLIEHGGSRLGIVFGASKPL